MKRYHIEDFSRGWFVGNFEPSIVKTNQVEVACQIYQKGDIEKAHHHRIAKEISVVASGSVLFNRELFTKGQVLVVEPFESVEFECLEDAILLVVKYPGPNNDKYEEE